MKFADTLRAFGALTGIAILSMQTPVQSASGYPCANFSIAAEVNTNGKLLGNYWYNPPELDEWLGNTNGGTFSFSVDGIKINDENFAKKDIKRLWPFAEARYSDPRIPDVEFAVRLFAPVKENDPAITTIPAILARITIKNQRPSANAQIKIAFSGGGNFVNNRDTITVAANSSAQLKFYWQPKFDANGFYANQFKNSTELKDYLGSQFDALEGYTQNLSSLMPVTGYTDIDEFTRYYMLAGIILTKVLKDSTALTMGYIELNQRDSYWTSFLHLVFFPGLDKKMLRESVAYQSSSGKIPTTILPVIERGDDIDINEYFVLRAFRHYEYYHDTAFLKELWPSLVKAIAWVEGRDSDGDGLPNQGSYWADWKDVEAMEGRKYGPHFCLLWVAVLKKAAAYALEIGKTNDAQKYASMYNKAFTTVNKGTAEGGLWNGKNYANIWKDGRTDARVLQDQVVGILFGVVSEERTASIYKALDDNGNKTEWGYREMWPGSGDYHNGGVWVYLNQVDAYSRFVSGYRDKGIWLLRTIAQADLVKDGDYLPNEYLNGVTGEQEGDNIQGWSAAYFGAVYFGLLNKSGVTQNSTRAPFAHRTEEAISINAHGEDLRVTGRGSYHVNILTVSGRMIGAFTGTGSTVCKLNEKIRGAGPIIVQVTGVNGILTQRMLLQ